MDDAHKARLEELTKMEAEGTIDENGVVELKGLREYANSFTDKVEETASEPEAPVVPKPTRKELEVRAAELGIDTSNMKKNAEVEEAIKAKEAENTGVSEVQVDVANVPVD